MKITLYLLLMNQESLFPFASFIDPVPLEADGNKLHNEILEMK